MPAVNSDRHAHADGADGQDGNTTTPTLPTGAEDQDIPAPLTRRVRRRDELSIIIGPILVLILDLAVPCIIYYVTRDKDLANWRAACAAAVARSPGACPIPPPEVFNQEALGYTIIPFGIGEVAILMVRCYRLIRHHDRYAPLLSTRWWELDATAWVYASALLVALIPFVVTTSISTKEPWLFIYAPAFLVAYLGIWTVLTLVPFKIPVRVDSEPRGTRVLPLVYYAAEDFMAVDGCQGRGFRTRYRARYAESRMFRRMIFQLNMFWIAGVAIYLGCVSAVIWKLPFEFAFGSSLGVLFFWVILWAILTYVWVRVALIREMKWYKRRRAKNQLNG